MIEQNNLLETLTNIFSDYIQKSNFFDIIYSEKFGYIYVSIQNGTIFEAQIINTGIELLDALFSDMLLSYLTQNDSHCIDNLDNLCSYLEKCTGRDFNLLPVDKNIIDKIILKQVYPMICVY